jgi:hypothetical protein
MYYDDLSIQDKAALMKMAVQNGITDVSSLRNIYNTYAGGGKKTTHKIGPTYNKDRKIWINPRGGLMPIDKGYYSADTKKYTIYNRDGSVSIKTPEEYAEYKNQQTLNRRKKIDQKSAIPFIKEKAITLTNAGRLTGATISTNLIDTIAKYGKEAGVPMSVAFGLPAKESTLAQGERGVGTFYGHPNANKTWSVETPKGLENSISPAVMVSDWDYFKNNPYSSYLNSTRKITDEAVEKEKAARMKKSLTRWDIGKRAFNKEESNFNYNVHPLVHAYTLFKNNPYGYNPGGYTTPQNVNKAYQELAQSPEFQKAIKESPFAY